MKKLWKKSVCIFASYLLAVAPVMADQDRSAYQKKALHTTLKLIQERQIITDNALETMSKVVDLRQDMQSEKIDRDIEGLKSGEVNLDDYKDSLVQDNLKQASVQKIEIRSYLNDMDEYELDILSSQLQDNHNYRDEFLEYTYAFTRIEKLRALEKAVFKDFDRLSTMTLKRIRSLDKEKAIQNLVKTREKIISDNKFRLFTRKEVMKALQIAGAVMLVVGIITWSRHYGDYKDARDERQRQLDDLRTKLENELTTLDNQLKEAELSFLNDNGYVFMQCGSYQRPDSIICSNYAYSVISGTKYCTVHCYKNIETGQETLHAPPVCTTPFIPSDCDDPLEYSRGYSAGEPYGLSDGADDGHDDGWDDGQDDGENDGEDDGYWDSYDNGYDDGWYDGYNSYYKLFKKSYKKNSSDRFNMGYEQGFKDAQVFSQISGF